MLRGGHVMSVNEEDIKLIIENVIADNTEKMTIKIGETEYTFSKNILPTAIINPCIAANNTKVNIFPKYFSLILGSFPQSILGASVFKIEVNIKPPTHIAKTEYIGAIAEP